MNVLKLTYDEWCKLVFDTEEHDVDPNLTVDEFVRSLDKNIIDIRLVGVDMYEIEFSDSSYKTWFVLKWM